MDCINFETLIQIVPNTLDTTVESFVPTNPPNTFVITGDINATWLRDSMNQVLPYIKFARQDPHLRTMICGLINRQANDIKYDQYANAFNYANEGGPFQDDKR